MASVLLSIDTNNAHVTHMLAVRGKATLESLAFGHSIYIRTVSKNLLSVVYFADPVETKMNSL